MGLFDNVKKASKSEDDVKPQNTDESAESLKNDNSDEKREIEHRHCEESALDDKADDEKTAIRNFKYLDDLIHSGAKEIVLDSDITLGPDEEPQYLEGIKLDVDNFTINGNGHTIDAQGKARIFHCTGKNVTIKDIALKNGFTKKDGGAICNYGDKFTMTNSRFAENKAKGFGGAIYDKSCELNITDSTFTENEARWSGGAIYNDEGELNITDSTFTENKAKLSGGAIENKGDDLTIANSAFTENKAKSGGSIRNYSNELNITDSAFTENKAMFGGAISKGEGDLTIANSTFTENKAKSGGGAIWSGMAKSDITDSKTITISNSNFEANSSLKYGGAINFKRSNCILNHCKFTNNKSKNHGGVIYHHGNYREERENNYYPSNIVCDSCDFYNNSSDNNGGTIWSNCYTEIYNSNFCDNISKKEGNIIYFDGMADITLNIENSFIRNNHAVNSDMYLNNSSFTSIINTKINNVSDNYVIYNKNSKLTILNLKSEHSNKKIIYNNNILSIDEDNAGFIKSTKKSVINYKTQIPTSIKRFQYLEELINENSGHITLDHDIIMDENEQNYFEGGIELEQDNLVLDGQNHTIDANKLSRIFIIMGNNITLKNIKFKNGFYFKNQYDQRKDGGGAIYSLPNTSVTIENCEFNENTSRNIAGCINNKGSMNIYRTKFNNNSAQIVCGTISNFNALNLDGCDFKNNFAPFDDSSKQSYNETAGNIVDEGNMVLNNCNFNKTKLYYIETLFMHICAIPDVALVIFIFLFFISFFIILIGMFLSRDILTFGLTMFTIICILSITAVLFSILMGKLISYYIRKQGFDYHNYSLKKNFDL